MHKDIAVKLHNISKVYKLYDKPVDRLKEALHPLKKKYHKDFYALKNINLEIKKGEVLGIVGVNGAGKSTLLKIIAGVLSPTSGRININGKLNAILELGSGLKPEMTGVQNIKLNLQINGIYEDMEKLTQEIIEFADIGEHIYQPVKTYSSGMKARLGFAIATSTDPDILIVDEVLAVGDVLFQRKCYTKIEKLFKDGKTVIFVSHSAQSVIEFCSRAVLLYDREIIMDDTPKKVTDFYQKLVFNKDKQEVINKFNGKVKIEKATLKKEMLANKEFYLPNLKSKQQFEKNFNVEIFDIQILDKDDKKVNILKTSETYTYTYKVRFLDNYRNVSFGMHIKTLKGFGLSSSASHYKKKNIAIVKKNDVFIIAWKFDCNLLENTYLTNAGVFIDNGSKISRIVDAYIFKVKMDNYHKIGIVDLNQSIHYRWENNG